MAELLQRAGGAVRARMELGNPSLAARWRHLAARRCPEPGPASGTDGASPEPEGFRPSGVVP